MSIDQHVQDLEDRALRALLQSGAIAPCPFHEDVLINSGDSEKNNKAYAISTNELKRDNLMDIRVEVLEAIKDASEAAADECPTCAYLRDT